MCASLSNYEEENLQNFRLKLIIDCNVSFLHRCKKNQFYSDILVFIASINQVYNNLVSALYQFKNNKSSSYREKPL